MNILHLFLCMAVINSCFSMVKISENKLIDTKNTYLSLLPKELLDLVKPLVLTNIILRNIEHSTNYSNVIKNFEKLIKQSYVSQLFDDPIFLNRILYTLAYKFNSTINIVASDLKENLQKASIEQWYQEIRLNHIKLSKASSDEDIEKVKAFIAKKVDINSQGGHDFFTPLMVAVNKGNEPLILYLLQNGADTNLKNRYGETALMIAVKNNADTIVQLLLDYNSKPNIKNNYEQTALGIARAQIEYDPLFSYRDYESLVKLDKIIFLLRKIC